MFWVGLGVGLIVGCVIGVCILAIFVVGKTGD